MSLTNDQVGHLFVSGDREHARSSNGNLSFDGDKLYSYSTVIAQRVRNAAGKVAYLVTSKRYSVTTSGKHMPAINRATNYGKGFTVFDIAVPRPGFNANLAGDDGTRILADMRASYDATLLAMSRATRYKETHLERAERIREQAVRFANFFDIPFQKWPEPGPEAVAAIKAAVAAEAEKRAEAERIKRERRMVELREIIADWRAGKRGSLPHDAPMMLRVIEAGETLETSMGARVPLADAVRAFKLAARCKSSGKGWHRNGETCPVGSFQVDAIYPSGDIKAGCHLIPWDESQRLAAELNVA